MICLLRVLRACISRLAYFERCVTEVNDITLDIMKGTLDVQKVVLGNRGEYGKQIVEENQNLPERGTH
jgi:hypothetical protein